MTLTRSGEDYPIGSHQRCTQVACACSNDPVRWISVRATRQLGTGYRDLRQHRSASKGSSIGPTISSSIKTVPAIEPNALFLCGIEMIRATGFPLLVTVTGSLERFASSKICRHLALNSPAGTIRSFMTMIIVMCHRKSTLRARFIRSVAEVELAQLRNRICKRESYRLEAVQYDCASTGSGNSLNRFTMGHRIGCSKRKAGSASHREIHTLSQ